MSCDSREYTICTAERTHYILAAERAGGVHSTEGVARTVTPQSVAHNSRASLCMFRSTLSTSSALLSVTRLCLVELLRIMHFRTHTQCKCRVTVQCSLSNHRLCVGCGLGFFWVSLRCVHSLCLRVTCFCSTNLCITCLLGVCAIGVS